MVGEVDQRTDSAGGDFIEPADIQSVNPGKERDVVLAVYNGDGIMGAMGLCLLARVLNAAHLVLIGRPTVPLLFVPLK